MPCHAPVPSDATAGEEADAMRPPRAPPRNLRGFQLGAHGGRAAVSAAISEDVGGISAAKKAPHAIPEVSCQTLSAHPAT